MNKTKTNYWSSFVSKNYASVKNGRTKKEVFSILSSLWKDKQADLVTIDIHYIEGLHKTIARLRQELEVLKFESMVLTDLLLYDQTEFD